MNDAPRAGPPPEKRERRPAGTEAAHLENSSDYETYCTRTDSGLELSLPCEETHSVVATMVVLPGEANRSAQAADVSEAPDLDSVEYFEVTNPTIDSSIKHANALHRESTLEAAFHRYEKLADFLESMGCTVITVGEGDWFNRVPRIYGGIFAASIASSREEWMTRMESLLPPEEGWVLQPILRSEMARGRDGRSASRRQVIAEKIASLPWMGPHSADVDAYITNAHPADLVARFRRWEQAGRSIDLYRRLGRRRDRHDGDARVEWLVEELLPAGMVVLFGGPREVGKSTMMLELAVAAASKEPGSTWLGQRLDPIASRGIAVVLTGEDTDAVINSRLERLDPDDQAAGIVVYALDGRPLKEIADEIARMPAVSLIIVDPARRYIEGDEDGSGNVSDFFATLESIVQRTGATVVVVHHLTKNAVPSSLQQVRDTIRGSGVFLDRPRVVLGCFRRSGTTIVGRIKSNLPPDFPIKTEIHLCRDPATLRHALLAAADQTEGHGPGEQDDLQQGVISAIRHLFAVGEKVTRAGANELWEKQVPELKGIGRNRIRATVDQLIAQGFLAAGENGIRIVR